MVTGDVLSTHVAALQQEAARLQCPGCMAPLPPPAGDVANVTCEYCGGTFALQTANAAMEKLRGDLRLWLNQLVRGAGAGASVDEAARRFIFGKELLPALQTSLQRAVETFDIVRFHPYFTVPLLAALPRSDFGEAVTRVVDSSGFKDALSTALARVQSPEIQTFATSDADRAQLSSLEARCLEAVHLTNARHQVHAFTQEGLTAAANNLAALERHYRETAKILVAHDREQATLLEAMADRAKGVRMATDAVRHVVEGHGFSASASGPDWDRAAETCESAATRMEQSGSHSLEYIATMNGARCDARGIRVLRRSMEIASECGASGAQALDTFFRQVSGMLARGMDANAGLDSAEAVLEQFSEHVKVRKGQPAPWVDGMVHMTDAAQALARSGLFSGKESVAIEGQVLVPFWVADLSFSQQTGVVFKKGHSADALLLLDASRHGQESFVVPPEAAAFGPLRTAFDGPSSLPGQFPTIAPLVSSAQARARWRQFVQSTPGYQGGTATLKGLVYLPVVAASYTNKKGSRQAGVMFGTAREVAIPQPQSIALGTMNLYVL